MLMAENFLAWLGCLLVAISASRTDDRMIVVRDSRMGGLKVN